MLKVLNINDEEEKNRLSMTIRGTEKEDFLLAQKIFRAIVSTNFCVESGFGYDEYMQEIPVFKYPKSTTITLLYEYNEQSGGRYGVTWVKKKPKEIG